MFDKDDKKFEG